MRGDNGELIRGRWRAGPSGHGVGGAHPAYVVRGEDTAEMMRYPGGNAYERVRLEQPPAAMMHGANDAVPSQQSRHAKKKGSWWENATWSCCGMERDDEGENRMRPVRHKRAAEPLFVGAVNTDVAAQVQA